MNLRSGCAMIVVTLLGRVALAQDNAPPTPPAPTPPAPDLKKVQFGQPLVLFNGKDLSGWRLTDPNAVNGWSVHGRVLPFIEKGTIFNSINFTFSYAIPDNTTVSRLSLSSFLCPSEVHPEPKTMIASPLMGHSTDARWAKARQAFWKENLSLKPPTK